MAEKTITLRADLVERLETLAQAQGRSLEDVLVSLLETQPAPGQQENWALALAEGMAAANIPWIDQQDASTTSRQHYQDDLYRRWQETQQTDNTDG